MIKQLKDLEQFHEKTQSFWSKHPSIDIPEREKEARIRIMHEEMMEVIAAIYKNEPIEDLAKELVDLIYVTLGTVGAFGLTEKFEAVFEAVHQSNMSKIGPDGKVHYNEYGKVIKPPGYTKPNIQEVLEK
jgi:predicted HAD superfamily Cof-like phosphohydrolase